MKTTNLSIELKDLELEDHACFLYSTEEEHRSIVSDFIRLGLERNEKVFCVLDEHSPEVIRGYLLCSDLVFRDRAKTGQLQVARYTGTDIFGGAFDPDRMVQWLRDETEFALAEGWSGLRLTTEMTWMLRKFPGSERVLEYEYQSNKFFCHSKCMALCQYDLRRFNPMALKDALLSHPVVIVEEEIYDNLYYSVIPPFMDQEPSWITLNHWLNDLAEHNASHGA